MWRIVDLPYRQSEHPYRYSLLALQYDSTVQQHRYSSLRLDQPGRRMCCPVCL